MTLLLLGLVLFLGTHAFTMARGPRAAVIARVGELGFKGLYAALSLAGFVAIIVGFGVYRDTAWVNLWNPPVFTRHLSLLLTLPIFVLFIAAYAPGLIKAVTKHPMLLAVKIWATAHLLANGDLGSMLLFGGFLAWAVMARISLKRRDGGPAPAGPRPAFGVGDIAAVGGGLVAWAAFVFWLHPRWIGVPVWPG